METVNEHAFGASFRLYGRDGLNVLFTVRASDAAAHIDLLETHLDLLEAIGYTVNLPGTEPGEQVEEVNAWVLGETSRDEPCVYLYSSNAGLKWRIATVYVEKMDQLPFTVSGSPWPGAAPEREMAEKKRKLHIVEPFKIVMKPTGEETSSGRPVLKFDRVLDAKPAAPAPPQQPAGNGNGNGQPTGRKQRPEPGPFYLPGDPVLVKGRNDERPGTIISGPTEAGKWLVDVDGKQVAASESRLSRLPATEQVKQPALIDAPDNVPGIEYLQD